MRDTSVWVRIKKNRLHPALLMHLLHTQTRVLNSIPTPPKSTACHTLGTCLPTEPPLLVLVYVVLI